MKYPILWLVRLYQVTLSGLMPNVCRYQPTCSQYMYEAVGRFGAVRGGWLGLRRLGRCNPWGGMGYDPVPERVSRETESERDRD